MRFALLLAALAPLAALAQTQADALTPVLVTFHTSRPSPKPRRTPSRPSSSPSTVPPRR